MPSLIKRIIQYNSTLPDNLRVIKYNAMMESPFRFYRGTCHLFAEDFTKLYGYKSKMRAWICGDLHFENFGSYKGENRLVYFDINDFDEAILATPHPEITRFLTSVIIAGNQLEASSKQIHEALKEIISKYAENLAAGKALMMERDIAHGQLKKYFDQLNNRNRTSFIAKHTIEKDGKLILRNDEKLHPIDEKQKKAIIKSLKYLLRHDAHFSNLEFEDVAFRIAGTGSLGLQRYCVLCYHAKRGKHYLIDIKQARESCYKSILPINQCKFKDEAERINFIGQIMQFNAPGFLTSIEIYNVWYVVKELQPVIDKMTLEDFNNDFPGFKNVAIEMAPLIAYAQLRSSGRKGSSTADELITFAEKQQWQKNIIELSGELANNNSRYYKQFLEHEKNKG